MTALSLPAAGCAAIGTLVIPAGPVAAFPQQQLRSIYCCVLRYFLLESAFDNKERKCHTYPTTWHISTEGKARQWAAVKKHKEDGYTYFCNECSLQKRVRRVSQAVPRQQPHTPVGQKGSGFACPASARFKVVRIMSRFYFGILRAASGSRRLSTWNISGRLTRRASTLPSSKIHPQIGALLSRPTRMPST